MVRKLNEELDKIFHAPYTIALELSWHTPRTDERAGGQADERTYGHKSEQLNLLGNGARWKTNIKGGLKRNQVSRGTTFTSLTLPQAP